MADHERKAIAARAPDLHAFDGTMELKGHWLSLTCLMIAEFSMSAPAHIGMKRVVDAGDITSPARHRACAGLYPSRSKPRRPESGDELPCRSGRLQSEDQR